MRGEDTMNLRSGHLNVKMPKGNEWREVPPVYVYTPITLLYNRVLVGFVTSPVFCYPFSLDPLS